MAEPTNPPNALTTLPRALEPNPHRTLDFSITQPHVNIVVGDRLPEQRPFFVHKNLICHHSPFFNRALNGSPVEGQPPRESMTMIDVPGWSFGLFVHWLYTGSIERPARANRTLIEYASLYSLSVRFEVPALQAALLSKIMVVQPVGRGFSSLRNFQRLAYSHDGDAILKLEAVIKTRQELERGNITVEELFAYMPAKMVVEFARHSAMLLVPAANRQTALREA